MKKVLLTALLLCFAVMAYCQGGRIVGREYFIDTDPGPGNGIFLAFSPADSISESINIATTTLSTGIHKLYLRYKNDSGSWGVTSEFQFNIIDTAHFGEGNAPKIAKGEYFIDTDPGVGNGTAISVAAADSATSSVSLPTAALSPGYHRAYFRYQNLNGQWGKINDVLFNVIDTTVFGNPPSPPIVSGEYFFDTDPGPGSGHPLPAFVSADTVSQNIALVVDSSLSPGLHTCFIRYKDGAGRWGETINKVIGVCPFLPNAAFTFVKDNWDVTFFPSNTASIKDHWDFGDGDTSAVHSPFHHFLPGVFDVYFSQHSDLCGISDTVHHTVVVNGLNSISPNTGANAGSVTVTLNGGVFVPGTTFSLKKAGQPDITGDTLYILDEGHMRTSLHLAGNALGPWDVQVITPTDTFLIPAGFTIIPVNPTHTNITITLAGSPQLKPEFQQIYTITVQNARDTDVYGVPVWIEGLPPNTTITYLNKVASFDSIPQIDSLGIDWSTCPTVFKDSISNTSFTGSILPMVGAGSIETMSFVLHPPDTTPAHSWYDITAAVDEPILPTLPSNPPSMSAEPDDAHLNDCIDGLTGLIEIAATKVLGSTATGKWSACASAVRKKFLEDEASILIKGRSKQTNITPLIEIGKSFNSALELAKPCAAAALLTAGVVLTPTAEFKILYNTVKIAKAISDGANSAERGYDIGLALYSCGSVIKRLWVDRHRTEVVYSWDPNEKYGPGGGSDAHYSNVTGDYGYMIGFENAPTASAPAQTVRVTDTLDKSKFDVSTFGFTSVTVGDSSAAFSDKPTSFIHDFDFRASMGVKVRVSGNIDTATGIVKWVFNSIDTLTNQVTRDALVGFLPPDTLAPLGQGYVTYLVNSTAGHRDTVHNRASIVFDFNAPILTHDWQTVVDLIKPHSTVNGLPPVTVVDTFPVTWHGTDTFSGIRYYDVFVSTNGGQLKTWLNNSGDTIAYFPGMRDSIYAFYCTATDSAGNVEALPTAYQAITQVRLPALSISGTDTVCAGMPVTFSAAAVNSGTAVVHYHWHKNALPVGIDSTGFTTSALATGDTISCLMQVVPPYGTAFSVLSDSIVMTINPNPVAGFVTGLDTLCMGSNYNFTASVSGGTWAAVNHHFSVAGNGTVTPTSAGGDTINYSVANVCGIAVTSRPVYISAVPLAGTIGGADSICLGSVSYFTASAIGGIWSVVNNHAFLAGNGEVTPVSIGVDTITYVVTNSCGTASVSKTFKILSLPSAGTISGLNYACIGRQPDTLTISQPGPGGLWRSVNGNATVDSGIVTGIAMGQDTIIYSVANFCGVYSDSFTVSIPDARECDSIYHTGDTTTFNGQLIVYPNPSSGSFEIELPTVGAKTNILIFDVLGKLLSSKELINNKQQTIEFKLNGAPKGSYLLKIIIDGKTYRTKIIVL